MSKVTRDWTIALAYVALIYLTLEVARLPLAYLRSQGLLRISLAILFSVTVVAILAKIVAAHAFSPWKLTALGAVFCLYYLTAGSLSTPEEQVHFFEYGLVGIFFLRALSHHLPNKPVLWGSAFALASLAGWCDELLQGQTPHRHYDIHDVWLNAVSAALGLVIYLISRRPIRAENTVRLP